MAKNCESKVGLKFWHFASRVYLVALVEGILICALAEHREQS